MSIALAPTAGINERQRTVRGVRNENGAISLRPSLEASDETNAGLEVKFP
jgi:hypothetical protein